MKSLFLVLQSSILVVGGVAGMIMVLVLTLPMLLLRAYVLQDLWAWFVVDAIAVKPISYLQAAGLVTIVMLFYRHRVTKKGDEPAHTLDDVILHNLLSMLFVVTVWFLAYLFHRYMLV